MNWHGGKGSTSRPCDMKVYEENFEKIDWKSKKKTELLENMRTKIKKEVKDKKELKEGPK